MRPVKISDKFDKNGMSKEYNPYGSAKIDLINEIGCYCSYCERFVPMPSLDIEHIRGQKVKNQNGDYKYKNFIYRWDNFLLACKTCNAIKGSKDIEIEQPFLPHQNNLLYFVEIKEGGTMSIKNLESNNEKKRVLAFIDLVGLDRNPSHHKYSEKDDRWQHRLQTKELAERYFKKYTDEKPTTDLETIVNLALANGFFSVWYYQFIDKPEVLEALIKGLKLNNSFKQGFVGTSLDSFDFSNNFVTLKRS